MTLKKRITVRQFLSDPKLGGNALPGPSWLPHRALMLAAFAEPLWPDELLAWREMTGRHDAPTEQCEELYLIAGRRSGKTRLCGAITAYVALCCDHSYLARGERATIPVMAANTTQAAAAFTACDGALDAGEVLSKQIADKNSEVIRLKNRVDISIRPSNHKTIRGITSPFGAMDEVGIWFNDETNASSDVEILNAFLPSLSTTGGFVYVFSTPWAKKGVLWDAYRRYYGKPGPVIVATGPTRFFNPTVPQALIDRAFAKDAFRAEAEWHARFRDGIAALLHREMVDAACDYDRTESAPIEGVNYVAFTDPSGGAVDSYGLSIGHIEDGVAVIDVALERKPPFSPEAVTREFAEICKSYGVRTVTGDRYAGQWPREQWLKYGVTYQTSNRTASDIFADVVPLFTGQRIAFPHNDTAVNQFACLERRTTRGGKSTISHPPGGHDDLAVTIAGVATLLVKKNAVRRISIAAPIFLNETDLY